MALKDCRECGTSISTEAKTCPSCGVKRPTGGRMSPGVKVLIALILVFLVIRCADSVSTDTTAVAPPPTPAASPSGITVRGERAALDFGAGEMTLTARLTSFGGAHPTRVWLWAFFINPGEAVGGSRSDNPILVHVDWGGLDTVTVTARGPFHWHNTSGVPHSGYLARIYGSDASASAAMVPVAARDKSPEGMIRVR